LQRLCQLFIFIEKYLYLIDLQRFYFLCRVSSNELTTNQSPNIYHWISFFIF